MTAGVEDEPVDEDVADVTTGSGPATVAPAALRPESPITVEQAYLAKLRAAGDGVEPAGPVSAPWPPPIAPRVLPTPPRLPARPRVEPETGILGLSRHTRSRRGARLFNLFFVCVFALILVQLIVSLLQP